MTLNVEQRQAEDAALDAADRDRRAGHRTIIIAQTSNEHLDELNARAQAIRRQHRELGRHSIAITHRPYRLRAGDEVQIRRTIVHPEAGRLANGTTAHVLAAHPGQDQLTLRLADDRQVNLEREQIDAADLRLAYVQHPFPAQGQTTDTAHLIVAEHATQQGTYVALTRARQRTDIHASQQQLQSADAQDEMTALAEHLGRQEPDAASIDTPLAHEANITAEQVHERRSMPARRALPQENEWSAQPEHQLSDPAGPPRDPRPPGSAGLTETGRKAREAAMQAIARYRVRYSIDDGDPTVLGPPPAAGAFTQRLHRRQVVQTLLDAFGQPNQDTQSLRRRLLEELGLAGGQTRSRGPDRGWEP